MSKKNKRQTSPAVNAVNADTSLVEVVRLLTAAIAADRSEDRRIAADALQSVGQGVAALAAVGLQFVEARAKEEHELRLLQARRQAEEAKAAALALAAKAKAEEKAKKKAKKKAAQQRRDAEVANKAATAEMAAIVAAMRD